MTRFQMSFGPLPDFSVLSWSSTYNQERTKQSECRSRYRVKVTLLTLLLLIWRRKLPIVNAYNQEYVAVLHTRRRNNIERNQLRVKPHSTIFSGTKLSFAEKTPEGRDNADDSSDPSLSKLERELIKRVTRLEALVAKQEVEIHKLKKTSEKLTETAEAFARVIQLLREAGLESDLLNKDVTKSNDYSKTSKKSDQNQSKSGEIELRQSNRVVESFDDSKIFGRAPSSVSDAADSAGAAILAAMLGGKQRMLVDVRDAELSSDPEILVQFIELAILPIAAGLEGLKSTRNRVKIVFPKVSQLLEYRRTMALAAPEVVALSTLGFDPVEKRDKLVVIVAPSPDDEEGLAAMRELISPASIQPVQQPVVILNYHMVPVSDLPVDFETAYHLRLLSVQYMSGSNANEYFKQFQKYNEENENPEDQSADSDITEDGKGEPMELEDQALEAAMKHAHEVGMNQGVTRAMVIRAYPRPWHVFVDTSPDTDADFEVAATFDKEPTLDEINLAIVECLEGSEREDEIVAQQMQQALEDGQLDKISFMIGEAFRERYGSEENEDDDDEEDDFDMFEEDSV